MFLRRFPRSQRFPLCRRNLMFRLFPRNPTFRLCHLCQTILMFRLYRHRFPRSLMCR